ncbi:AbiV family abortive infection protein [Altererythrobacter confluentis]|uniref:AbiV family abortive infection protein n=1 Tax=Allopontixanthobacter confluentis TaxID=1849021 RepID=A0A6L7GKK5_9SPHN|nr:AbiV family abortive infection protein [Allopontixanthobacter confluentis]MXP15824.1 AbiV family abortive infection protein [Allopontixanthobacter confluentis]
MPLDRNDPIIQNVIRLYNDASLLREHGRNQSAYALSLIGAEETAKVIIDLWGEMELPKIKRLRTWHLTKQLVLASLSQASVVTPFITQGILHGENVPTSELMREIDQAWKNSHHRSQFAKSYNELWENAKHRALYADTNGTETSLPEVSESEVHYLLSSIRESIVNMADRYVLGCGYVIYEYSAERRKNKMPAF